MYNFDEIIKRETTLDLKYYNRKEIFGTEDVLPMWIADMDFPAPEFITEAIKKRLSHPVFGYFVHSEGFYNSIINWMKKRHQWEIKKEWINSCPGIVTGLASAVQAFTKEGDKILVQTPVYHPFYFVINNQKRQIVRSELDIVGNEYHVNFERLENKLKEGVKMLINSNPHNPVGKVWTKEELQKINELCLKYNCIVVSDEIHSDLMMKGYKHTPNASISEEIANNTITFMAPSKTFNLAGMSTSESIIPNKSIRDRFQEVMEGGLHLGMGNTFGDATLEAAYSEGEKWMEELLEYIEGNVNYCKDFIAKNLPKLKTFKHQATYLLWVDFRELGLTHEELCDKLVNKAKLGFNDGIIFGEEGRNFMRINLACPRSTVIEAMNRLTKIMEK